jgi:hypothetical protein
LSRDELIDHIVGVYGKDTARIHAVAERGTLVSGASRLRWEGFAIEAADLTAMLSRFPDPDPTRLFSRDRCTVAVLRGGGHQIALSRDAAAKRRLFKRQSFWDHLMAFGPAAAYLDYSYREKADVFRAAISPAAQASLQAASGLLSYGTLTRQLNAIPIDSVDLYVSR